MIIKSKLYCVGAVKLAVKDEVVNRRRLTVSYMDITDVAKTEITEILTYVAEH
jgi:predicted nucleic acid-binding OB-fold protein